MVKSPHATTRNETQISKNSSNSMLNDPIQYEIITLHTNKEKEMLSRLAKQTTQGAIVEIGSFLGASTIILAGNANEGCEVFAIDPHTGVLDQTDKTEVTSIGDTWTQFQRNIQTAGVSDKIKAFRMKSEEAAADWTEQIGLLFIDGSHCYEDVKKDILLWKPYLLSGSNVIFHDLGTVGVQKAIIESILFDPAFSNFRFTPCCMFTTTFLPNKTFRQQVQRTYWYLLFKVEGALSKISLIRKALAIIARRV